MKWDAGTETLQPEMLDDDSMARYRLGLVAMDRFLGAYQYDVQLKKWLSLSDQITADIIAASVSCTCIGIYSTHEHRLQPISGVISSVTSFEPSITSGSSSSSSSSSSSRIHANTLIH